MRPSTMIRRHGLAGLVAVLALVTGAFVAPAAATAAETSTSPVSAAPTPSPRILGGEPSTNESVVTVTGGGYYCSGVAVSPSYVLTARHCPNVEVTFISADSTSRTTVAVDRTVDAPSGDVRLLHLSTPHALASYPDLVFDFVPNDSNIHNQTAVFGVGTPDFTRQTATATIVVSPETRDLFGGTGIVLNTAPARPGDSGGPLMVADGVVGLASVIAGDGVREWNIYSNLRSTSAEMRALIANDRPAAFDLGLGLIFAPVGDATTPEARLVRIDGTYRDSEVTVTLTGDLRFEDGSSQTTFSTTADGGGWGTASTRVIIGAGGGTIVYTAASGEQAQQFVSAWR